MVTAPCKYLFLSPYIYFNIYVCFFFNHILFLGCRNGPMNAEVKTRRSVVRRKRARPTQSSQPEDVSRILDLLTFLCVFCGQSLSLQLQGLLNKWAHFWYQIINCINRL